MTHNQKPAAVRRYESPGTRGARTSCGVAFACLLLLLAGAAFGQYELSLRDAVALALGKNPAVAASSSAFAVVARCMFRQAR